MTASIARYLKDFGEPVQAPPVLAEDFGDFEFSDGFNLPDVSVEAPVDIAAEREAAHANGFQAGLAEARRQASEEREQLLKAHADELEAVRSVHQNEIASIVERKLAEAALLVAEAVSEQTAKVLAPVVEEGLTAKAVADLADLLRSAIIEGDVAEVTLRGPAPLFDKVTAALGDEHANLLRHMPADDLDITAEIGDAALVTRLSAWSARLREVLA